MSRRSQGIREDSLRHPNLVEAQKAWQQGLPVSIQAAMQTVMEKEAWDGARVVPRGREGGSFAGRGIFSPLGGRGGLARAEGSKDTEADGTAG